MKKALAFFTFLGCLWLTSCEQADILVGNHEYIVTEYANTGTPSISVYAASPNLSYDDRGVSVTDNGMGDVNIVFDGIRVSNGFRNFTVADFSIQECDGDLCGLGGWEEQFEFDQDTSFQRTDVLAVLVLDVSTSLSQNINQLKSYAKDFAQAVVESTPNSYVAVVLFSEEIEVIGFENINGITTITQAIDGYTDYQSRTTLLGACEVGINLLNTSNLEGSKNLIVFTDGGDNNTDLGVTVLSRIQSSEINRFAIGLDGEDFDRSLLRSIASSGSNFVVAESIDDLEGAFTSISSQVANVYRIQYNRSDQLLDAPIRIRFKLEIDQTE